MTVTSSTTQLGLPVATTYRTGTWLIRDLRGRCVTTTCVILFSLVTAAVSTLPVYLVGLLVDRVRDGDSSRAVVGLAAVIGVAALIGGLGAGLSTYLVRRLGECLVADLREEVLERALHLPATTIEQSGRGDVLSRVGTDIAVVTRAASQVVPTALSAVFLVVVTLIAFTSMDWRLGLAGALCVPVYAMSLRWYLPRSGPMYADERVAAAALAQAIVESTQGAKTIEAYEIHGEHLAQIQGASAQARDITIEVFALVTRFVGRINSAEFIGLTATLVAGFILTQAGLITVGQTTAAALMFCRLFIPIGMLMYNFDEVQSGAASLARLVGVLDLKTVRRHPQGNENVPPTPTGSDVELMGVSYCYSPGSQVLHGVSLHIPSGTRCALVGSTGAGKTTLASIVAGLLAPTSGHARIGGVDISEINPDEVSRWVAVITQEVHVFSGPLIDDLRLGAPHASPEEIWAVLRRLGADDWASDLDDGLDTLVGEGGLALTPVQAQQVAMARLMLADPQVVVLDEATAEAGSVNAAELEDAAVAVMTGRTSLVVAHRLTQAATADYVAVMADGRIVEGGTPAELLALNGHYARLWQAWRTHSVPPPPSSS